MLKIIITDPHTMDKESLAKTGKYLLELASITSSSKGMQKDKEPIERAPVPMPSVVVPPPPPIVPPTPFQAPIALPKVSELPHNPFAPHPLPTPHDFSNPTAVRSINTLPWTDSDNQLNTVDKDVNGLPWDGRIHSRGKSKNVDGTWRYMRGIQDAVVAQVENELRSAVNAPRAPSKPTGPITITKETGITTYEEGFIDGIPAFPAPPPVEDQNDFPAFMTKITAAINSQKITQVKLIEIVKSFGLQSVAVVPTRLDLIPAINAAIDAEIMSNSL